MKTPLPIKEPGSRSSPSSRTGSNPSTPKSGRIQEQPTQATPQLDYSAELLKAESGEEISAPIPRAHVDGWESRPIAPLSVRVLAFLATAAVIYLAEAVLMPITVAFLLALTLRPVVRRARKLGLPEPLSAALLLAAMVAVSLGGAASVIEPARKWMESAPGHIETVKEKFSSFQTSWKAFSNTSAMVKELTEPAASDAPVAVEMRESQLMQHVSIATGTGNALGHCLVVLVLSFFVLTSGDHLLSQILAGLPRMSEKKRTVELVREVEQGIASYLFTVTMINAGLAVATGIGFWLLGVPNPALWAVMAFLFNYVPFFGPAVCTVIVALVSLLSFDSVAYACVPPLYFIVISAVEGNLLTPMIVGRSMSLNPIILFVALIVGGWAWGLGGAILAVPLLAVIKIASDKFQTTQPLARLLAG
ncbi:MAG TPA: AI-2E family transporter [Planctomycetaceae bacterium]|nr:AI-2E family transporter [Planctomycetaceae bacterium]